MPKDAYINYLKTYSGYNQYLVQNPNEEDPLKMVRNEKYKEVCLKFDFFKI